MYGQVLDKITPEYNSKIDFYKVDVEESQDLAMAFNARSLPTTIMISKSGKPFVKVLDQDRVRPTDITLQIPDTSRFRNDFNWKPKKKMDDIWNDLLEYWRGIV